MACLELEIEEGLVLNRITPPFSAKMCRAEDDHAGNELTGRRRIHEFVPSASDAHLPVPAH